MNNQNKKKKDNLIRVFGAREHNLKNIDVAIPKNKLTVITGPSGSGKSSLAFDVLFAEGQRRYLESLSSYARQFLGMSKKPNVDRIEGLCPAVAIEQKKVSSNPRSTVGTVTEIYDHLRVLYARVGTPHCPECGNQIKAASAEHIATMLANNFAGKMITVAAPLVIERKGEFVNDLLKLFKEGYYRFRIDGQQFKFHSEFDIKKLKLGKTYKHTIDILLDLLEVMPEEHSRLLEAIEIAFKRTGGMCRIIVGKREYLYSSSRICLNCAYSIPELEPRYFSFNSPVGACEECHGLGIIQEWPWDKNDPDAWKADCPEFFGPKYATEYTCSSCAGKRLNKLALAVTINGKNIYDLCDLSITTLLPFFQHIELDKTEHIVAAPLLKEIINRLNFLQNVGLSYLTLNRPSRTLSGGEGQRIRLATQIGSSLSGVLYVLDEPSIGLHQRDNGRLIATLKKLRDQGNTVVVVEHDIDTMRQADHLIDMGPAAGVLGGKITTTGTPKQCAAASHSLTGDYLAGRRSIAVPAKVRTPVNWLVLRHARAHNLKDITVKFPLGILCGISGVSGSGKSSLIIQELVPALKREFLSKRRKTKGDPDLEGAENIAALVVIDQSTIGRTPRSNPATYLGIFDQIRQLFARLPESNARGYKPGRFSFNVSDGRCFECRGDGTIKVSMHFLPDVTMTCKTCNGKRYNTETLSIKYRGKNIAEVLEMTAYEAHEFFAAHSNIAKRLQLMCDVGLDYLQLGQPSTTLSGGEAQRIKLVDELAKRGSRTFYILDEPTTGLHNCDIEKLLKVLNTLVDKGNSMIVIEHNLDVLKTVDYLIDLGPEGGDEGGTVVAQGKPVDVARCKQSYTGSYLKAFL
ncbi:excinuclease ABC subunit A [Candidatus Dependentiae bacterium]|nr:MAG: excinuclease ABC subunit A [Candidatus Dependentiae bacterium]